MVTCFILAGQIVLSLSAPITVIEDDGTEVEEAIVETVIFPRDTGVRIHSDGMGMARLEFFEGGQKQDNPTIIDTFTPPYEEVVAALSNCWTD